MPVNNFSGNTFVAFTDISGFKQLMKNDKIALDALRHFYQAGYNALRNNDFIEGFFVSDCGILFARNGNDNLKLTELLKVLTRINKVMLEKDLLLTTSIAYGRFEYEDKIEFPGIEKNQIYGGAYVQAFLDNEVGTPRIQPGQCRLLVENLPNVDLENFPLLTPRGHSQKHRYHYWNVNNPEEIPAFETKYQDSYSLKYSGMINALKN